MNNVNIITSLKRVVLVVDDEEINQEIIAAVLENQYELIRAYNGQEALECLKQSPKPVSLILLDLSMPVMDGKQFLQIIKADPAYKRIPVIVSTADKASELLSLQLGATDFVTKPYEMPEIISARIGRAIELSEDRMIITASERDEISDVYNRHVFVEYVAKLDLYSPDEPKDMVYIILEKLPQFEEAYGIEAAHRLLRNIANALKVIARDCDGIVGRGKSPDTFIIYMKRPADRSSLMRQVEETIARTDDSSEDIQIRIGIYPCDDASETVEARIGRASFTANLTHLPDLALCVFDAEVRQSVLFQQRLAREAVKAVEQNQFTLYYQPKINIQGDRPVLAGCEGLVRWVHPELGFISPGVFIPLFEENGFIRQLDRYVWRVAAKQAKKWKDEYGLHVPISVNVSRIDLYDQTIPEVILGICKEEGITPADMHLEITETAYNPDSDQLVEIVSRLRSYGFIIEIDDFGSGYSSLNALAMLPFDVLKLDMKFVREMTHNEKVAKMVAIAAEIGRFLDVPLVAEGAEEEAQIEKLKSLGYNMVQGYYFSKPLPPQEFAAKFLEGGKYNA